jgi:hypothetical protein
MIHEDEIKEVVIVKNVQGHSDLKCNCGTCIDHWENVTGFEIETCVNLLCSKNTGNPQKDYGDDNPIVGGHVQKILRLNAVNEVLDEKEIWIIPICDHCNKKGKDKELPYYYVVEPDPELFATAKRTPRCV